MFSWEKPHGTARTYSLFSLTRTRGDVDVENGEIGLVTVVVRPWYLHEKILDRLMASHLQEKF